MLCSVHPAFLHFIKSQQFFFNNPFYTEYCHYIQYTLNKAIPLSLKVSVVTQCWGTTLRQKWFDDCHRTRRWLYWFGQNCVNLLLLLLYLLTHFSHQFLWINAFPLAINTRTRSMHGIHLNQALKNAYRPTWTLMQQFFFISFIACLSSFFFLCEKTQTE